MAINYSVQTRKLLLSVRTEYPLLSVLRLEIFANGFHPDSKSIIRYNQFNLISDIRYRISSELSDYRTNGLWTVTVIADWSNFSFFKKIFFLNFTFLFCRITRPVTQTEKDLRLVYFVFFIIYYYFPFFLSLLFYLPLFL